MASARARTQAGAASWAAACAMLAAATQPKPNSTIPAAAGAQWWVAATSAMPTPEHRLAANTVLPRPPRPRRRGSDIPAVTPPTPISPSSRPKLPAPRPSCSRTTSGSRAQMAEHGRKKATERTIAARIAGVWRTNCMPARIADTKCSRGRVLRATRRRQRTRAPMPTTKERA